MYVDMGRRRRKHARVRIAQARRDSWTRPASAVALFGICAMVLAANALWQRLEPGYPMGAAVPTASSGQVGPMLSLDIDITADPGCEVASSRWTSSQEGVIELYARDESSSKSGGYRLLDRVQAGPVVELSQVALAPSAEAGLPGAQPDKPIWGVLLVAAAEYDQSVGALSRSTVTTAYAWDGRKLVEVWSATTQSEAVWNLGWGQLGETAVIGRGARLGAGDWVRLTGVSKVEFSAGPRPSIMLRSSQKHESYDENNDAFTTIKSREVAQTYYWSDRWSAFILSEAIVGRDGATGMEYPRAAGGFSIAAGTDLAVLEAEGQCVEGLVFSPPHLLRVKLPDGRRCFVGEGSVLPMPSRAMV